MMGRPTPSATALFVAATVLAAATPRTTKGQGAAPPADSGRGGAASPWAMSAWVGGGASAPVGIDRAARKTGRLAMGALEFDFAQLPVGLRVEGSLARHTVRGTGLDADVETAQAVVAARWSPVSASRVVAPYALLGMGWARPSTRVVLNTGSSPVPSARFTQVTHEVVASGLVGVGVTTRVRRAHLFAESRLDVLTPGETTSFAIPLVVGARLPLR